MTAAFGGVTDLIRYLAVAVAFGWILDSTLDVVIGLMRHSVD